MSRFKLGMLGVLVAGALVYLAMHHMIVENLASSASSETELIISNEVKGLLASLSSQKQKQQQQQQQRQRQANSKGLSQFELDLADTTGKYLVYQPLSGFKQELEILKSALVAANAMDRILIIPSFGKFSPNGYSSLLPEVDMAPVDLVLDMDALNLACKRGVKVFRGHLDDLHQRFNVTGRWKQHSHRLHPAMQDNKQLTKDWGQVKERVVYWKKSAIIDCCAGTETMDPYILPHMELKLAALRTIQELFHNQPFAAVDVNPKRYALPHFIATRLHTNGINESTPLFIYTEDENLNWFNPLREAGYQVYFAHHIRPFAKRTVLDKMPTRVHAPVLQFMAQLVSARAMIWVPGDDSTVIEAMRQSPALVQVDWRPYLTL
ncbi:hypothetical protein BASA81_010736 [Batrachochytrium salamandrivorans]|nr:hypothetical protein BASA81_010736 [Batrachochytrium salamandrivorans]